MSIYARSLLAAFLALSFAVPPACSAVAPERSEPPSASADRPLVVAQYDPCANNGCPGK